MSAVLVAVFTMLFKRIDFRIVKFYNYRLFQFADFVCMIEFLRIKQENNILTNSEKQFFYRPREIKKVFLRSIDKKKI